MWAGCKLASRSQDFFRVQSIQVRSLSEDDPPMVNVSTFQLRKTKMSWCYSNVTRVCPKCKAQGKGRPHLREALGRDKGVRSSKCLFLASTRWPFTSSHIIMPNRKNTPEQEPVL